MNFLKKTKKNSLPDGAIMARKFSSQFPSITKTVAPNKTPSLVSHGLSFDKMGNSTILVDNSLQHSPDFSDCSNCKYVFCD